MSASEPKTKRKPWAALPPLLLCVTSAWGQEAASIPELRATEHPSSKVGLAIGEHIPEFHALDQNGVMRDFDSIRGPKGAVFYFHRSADWCIYCRGQLVETEASREALLKNGLGFAGISYDSPEILKKFSTEKGIRFPLLSDPESKIIRDFQVLDATVLPGSPGYGVPYHGHYIVDETGTVVAKLFETETTLAHSAGVVVSKLFGSPLNTHEKVAKLDHLTLSYYASANSVSPGDEIELFIDVDLNDHIHVYAPPGGPFIPVGWQIAAASVETVDPVTFPAAQTRLLNGAAGDTAAVYTGSFRLSRRVTIAPEGLVAFDSQGNIALKGTFAFQACNEDLCFVPTSIPLEWKLGQAPSSGRAASQQHE